MVLVDHNLKDLLYLIKDLAQVLYISLDVRNRQCNQQIDRIRDSMHQVNQKFVKEERRSNAAIKAAVEKAETKALQQASDKF